MSSGIPQMCVYYTTTVQWVGPLSACFYLIDTPGCTEFVLPLPVPQGGGISSQSGSETPHFGVFLNITANSVIIKLSEYADPNYDSYVVGQTTFPPTWPDVIAPSGTVTFVGLLTTAQPTVNMITTYSGFGYSGFPTNIDQTTFLKSLALFGGTCRVQN